MDVLRQRRRRVGSGVWAYLAIRGLQDANVGYLEVSANGGAWERIITGDTTNLAVRTGTRLVLGEWPGGGQPCNTHGVIDEVRISQVARSDDWIRAQYRWMVDQLVSYGSEQRSACP